MATHFKRRLLGELYSDLVLAKFDVVANDPDDDKLVTEGLPALVMYNATRSRKPVIYHGEFCKLQSVELQTKIIRITEKDANAIIIMDRWL